MCSSGVNQCIYQIHGTTKSGYPYCIVDFDSFGRGEVSGNHVRYHCPFCLNKGKFDKKLYYNILIGVGFCFRCEVVFISSKGKSIALSYADQIPLWVNYDREGMSDLLDISWTTSALHSIDVLRYLHTRPGAYSDDIIQKYNIRFFVGVDSKIYILLPDTGISSYLTRAFQITPLVRNGFGPKYLTFPKTKFVFYLDMALSQDCLILVEGIFDAIASGGCPILGVFLSKSQLMDLFWYFRNPGNKNRDVFVVLDGDVKTDIKFRLCKQVTSVASDRRVYYVDLPCQFDSYGNVIRGLDPEESVSRGVFFECLSKARRFIF